MHADEAERRELLDRIIAEGDRRRHRRRLLGGGGGLAAVALVAVAAVVWAGDGGDERVDVAAQDSTTTTEAGVKVQTTEPRATSTTVTVPPTTDATDATDTTDTTDTTTATSETPAATTLPPPAVETTTTVRPCRNSNEPRCGDFYWDVPADFLNEPIQVQARAEDDTVPVGGGAIIVVTAYDPDAPVFQGGCNIVSASGLGPVMYEPGPQGWGLCSNDACYRPGTQYGPWDVPDPSPDPGAVTVRARVLTPEAGTYTVTVLVQSGPPDCTGAFDGYDDSVSVPITITVEPA